jgi:uncharacterized pyridoxamine 5'-phosphate oxidase family protein
MNAQVQAFLEKNHQAAMTALRADGTPHVSRVNIALVDGKIWSSGAQIRFRTKLLRRDPRSTLFVFENQFAYLTLECRVTILDGPDVPELSIRLSRALSAGIGREPPDSIMWYGLEWTPEQFRKLMVDEKRVIYEFEPLRHYGLFGSNLPR